MTLTDVFGYLLVAFAAGYACGMGIYIIKRFLEFI